LIKYAVTVGGIIAIAIIAFYVFGMEPTYLELDKGNFPDKNYTKFNQTGKTEPYATVTINGESVAVDRNGNFYNVVDVKNGVNTIVITSKAPFKSQSQLYAFTNRTEDKDGAASVEWWSNNSIIDPSKYYY
jgi:hypothetical protein